MYVSRGILATIGSNAWKEAGDSRLQLARAAFRALFLKGVMFGLDQRWQIELICQLKDALLHLPGEILKALF
jgi:hypothetical protein